ncbi:glycosyltransferase family 2 protein [Clostridium estertheticum]|uniref:glycosyltransferase family 2 protein n=1 Tax=Clostridium estertheticum TaxID=238834 RepID=UPI0013E90A30|nr:glycosyltransferase family 2 protein [Clostridium estertheticum]MBZ9687620.1 glycosyltransferase family 2 protein [Clostridium estertheticum]
MNGEGNVKVSVVIPCRNEEKYIGKCLQSIMEQSYGIENIEVFVCDGCSDDSTLDIIKEYSIKYPQIKLVINEKRVAPTAMNLGIKAAVGEIIVIFGAHAYMNNDYIHICVEKLKSSDIACVGGRIINISEDSIAEAISLAMASPFGVGNALFRFSNVEQLVDTVAFGAYKKSIFSKIGYFDEELVRNQDDELNFRITKSGNKILLAPDIISHYYTRGSFSKLWTQYFQYGFWKVRVIQKHKKPSAVRHLIPLLFVLSLISGTLLSPFSKIVRFLFSAEILAYLAGAITFSLKAYSGKVKNAPKMIIAFLILHLSYGIGFLEGLIVFYILKSNKPVEKNTKSSR